MQKSGEPELVADVLNPQCPSRTVLRHLTDRWTGLIVVVLADGPRRFGEVRAGVGGITPKVLTETLRSMERDGLIERRVTASVPLRVDYELTALGRTAVPPLETLRMWAQSHADTVLANRERYDAVDH